MLDVARDECAAAARHNASPQQNTYFVLFKASFADRTDFAEVLNLHPPDRQKTLSGHI